MCIRDSRGRAPRGPRSGRPDRAGPLPLEIARTLPLQAAASPASSLRGILISGCGCPAATAGLSCGVAARRWV
eukprot:3299208-Alexandrium_andersonii.AAC.1